MSTCLLHSFFLGSKYLTLSGAFFRQDYFSWYYPCPSFCNRDMKHLKIGTHFWTWFQKYRERKEQRIVHFETSAAFFNLWLASFVSSQLIHTRIKLPQQALRSKIHMKCRNFSPQHHDSPFIHEASCEPQHFSYPHTIFLVIHGKYKPIFTCLQEKHINLSWLW